MQPSRRKCWGGMGCGALYPPSTTTEWTEHNYTVSRAAGEGFGLRLGKEPVAVAAGQCEATGWRVASVQARGNAHTAGLRSGDVVTHMAGRPEENLDMSMEMRRTRGWTQLRLRTISSVEHEVK